MRRAAPRISPQANSAVSSLPPPGPPVRWQVDGYALMQSKVGAASSYGVLQAYP